MKSRLEFLRRVSKNTAQPTIHMQEPSGEARVGHPDRRIIKRRLVEPLTLLQRGLRATVRRGVAVVDDDRADVGHDPVG